MAEHLTPCARRSKLVVCELADETIVYDLERHRAHCLNRTAALVWELCDGEHTVSLMSERMGERLSARVPEELVRLALGQLADRDLLMPGDFVPEPTPVSRRAMMRRLGLAAAIALPLVTSIISPTPVMAQSPCSETSCPPGTTCQAGICEPDGI